MKALFVLYSLFYFNANNIASYFGNNYYSSVKAINADAGIIDAESKKLNCNEQLIKAVVFPEYLRASIISGLIEEKSLEALYIQNGETDVDYSVGKFQIKPSFANKLEKAVAENKYHLKEKYQFLIISSQYTSQERAIRVARLKDLKWQTRYLCCFIDYGLTHLNIQHFDNTEQKKYLSTLYNFGLNYSKAEIESFFECKCFPYGKKYDIEQVNYWEAALSYNSAIK